MFSSVHDLKMDAEAGKAGLRRILSRPRGV
jgi:hypothetical protein